MERSLSTALQAVMARRGPRPTRDRPEIRVWRPRLEEYGSRFVAFVGARSRQAGRSHSMRTIARFMTAIFSALMVASIAGTVAAFFAKQRIVPKADPDADDVALVGIFGPLAFHSTAENFRGGTIDCWYGGGLVDLRGAHLAPEGAHLRVQALFGGAQLVVPEDWQITSRVRGIGGLGDARPKVDRPADAPHLTIDGWALFGGFGVSSEMPEQQAKWLKETEAKTIASWHTSEPAATSEPTTVPEEVVPVG
jgi:hypothetical protein